MSGERDGVPAFPQFGRDPWGKGVAAGGMTLRDWFAGQALTGIVSGLCANPGTPPDEPCRNRAMGRLVFEHAVADAYQIADAAMAARALPRGTT